eukprot:scaffold213689_cov47-Prasinocladus_malaysianus.AAC.1
MPGLLASPGKPSNANFKGLSPAARSFKWCDPEVNRRLLVQRALPLTAELRRPRFMLYVGLCLPHT